MPLADATCLLELQAPVWASSKNMMAQACYGLMLPLADACVSWSSRLGLGLFQSMLAELLYSSCFKNPHHKDMYINSSDYLALLNNERPNPNSTAWKQNFLRIKKLVLIGGPDDGVITPWQSSQFGFYDDNETVIEMKNQKVFLMDLFGLKTLYARGDLALCSMAGVAHVFWHSNETVYKTCIEKWLT
ncbi:Lysosomal thioesterase PPT2 [Anabarilius grahami]|uniref:palmitoyl-CoA hydrolase n=1 Tax=Anabarilius grahami TaxID=495550 RepID=A0A3N0YPZ8_ANAGA|nr:Lysosomal thioesterase PPT2 [Anabarilius grahami]